VPAEPPGGDKVSVWQEDAGGAGVPAADPVYGPGGHVWRRVWPAAGLRHASVLLAVPRGPVCPVLRGGGPGMPVWPGGVRGGVPAGPDGVPPGVPPPVHGPAQLPPPRVWCPVLPLRAGGPPA